MSRHGRTESVAIGGASWLPPFPTRVQELLAAPINEPGPMAFVPIGWLDATFPRTQAKKGGKIDLYLTQLRRAVKDLSRSREVTSDATPGHALLLHSIEGLAEAYSGLLEGVRAMLSFQEQQIKANGGSTDMAAAAASPITAANAVSPLPTTTSGSPISANSDSQRAQSPYTPSDSPSPANSTGGSAAGGASPAPADDPTSPRSQLAELQMDYAALLQVRKHCVRTLRALRNLHLLVCGVDSLRDVLSDSEFQAARLAFAAITELFHTLSMYNRLPIITTLNEHVESYKGLLRKDIFAAFREHMGNQMAVNTPSPTTPPRPMARQQSQQSLKMQSLVKLHHCCRLIDLLYSSLERKELVKWWIAVELHDYQTQVSRRAYGDVSGLGGASPVTASGSIAAFEQMDAQFNWILTELRDSYDAEYAQVFPAAWYVDALLTRRFFELVRAQFAATLEAVEKRIADENERRRAVAEAKKARQLMLDIQKLQHSNSKQELSANRRKANTSADGSAGGSTGGNTTGNSTGDGSAGAASPNDDVESMDSTPVVFDFYRPLLRPIELENGMRALWLNEKTEATGLTEEDLFAVLGTVPNPALNLPPGVPAPSNPPPYPFQFAGYISSAFHPFLPSMILAERTRFYNFLEQLDEEDSWEVESADVSVAHFNAATTLFLMIQKSMERHAKVMPGDCFLDLYKEYRTAISNYIELLSKHLPSGKALQEEEMQALCFTINTGDYVAGRCAELANRVVSMLAGQTPEQLEALTSGEDGAENPEAASFIAVLREQVDLSGVEEQVSHLNHRATHALAAHIVQNKLRPALQRMKDSGKAVGMAGAAPNGAASVSDENKYVRDLQSALRSQLQDKARMSSFPYLCQVVAVDFLKEYHATLRACASHFRITEQVAQQMLLDLQALKHFLVNAVQDWRRDAQKLATQGRRAKEQEELKAALLGGDGAAAADVPTVTVLPAFKAYVKLLQAQLQPSELLLKALTSPSARLITTFKAIVPSASHEQVYELLALRGLSGSEQEKLVKAYNAAQGANADPRTLIPIVKKDFFGQMSQMVRDVKHSIQDPR